MLNIKSIQPLCSFTLFNLQLFSDKTDSTPLVFTPFLAQKPIIYKSTWDSELKVVWLSIQQYAIWLPVMAWAGQCFLGFKFTCFTQGTRSATGRLLIWVWCWRKMKLFVRITFNSVTVIVRNVKRFRHKEDLI